MLDVKDFSFFENQNSFDFKGFLIKTGSYWRWFLFGLVVCLVVAHQINIRKQNIYSLETTIAIQEQDNPLFTGIAPGNYLGYARDKNGCGLSDPFTIYVLDYPRFFTPNGDGFNDVWKIKNLDLFPKATITIYDRYGKFIKELNKINPSWNGTYIGNELPATDYWFNLNFGDGKIIKGHFSLKR